MSSAQNVQLHGALGLACGMVVGAMITSSVATSSSCDASTSSFSSQYDPASGLAFITAFQQDMAAATPLFVLAVVLRSGPGFTAG